MSDKKHLVIAAAGTGGHVMPGLAVAQEMQSRGWTVSWIGTSTGMERRLVEKHDIEFDELSFSGLRGKGLMHMIKGAFKLLVSSQVSRKILAEREATAVFSTGGYIAVPAATAAKRCGVPLVMMNCDADSLMSVRAVMPWSKKVMCGFDGECAKRAGDKAVVSGNPVRADILALPAPAERYRDRSGPLNILVFGGSLGARVLNETLPTTLSMFNAASRPNVIHQCGKNAVENVKAEYARMGIQAQVVEFIDDMASAYKWADLVICRAGATSVSELCAAGVPAILVPFVVSTTQHQLGNAQHMQAHRAGILIEQKDFTAQRLYDIVVALTRSHLMTMAENARKLSRRNAAKTVADEIEALVKDRK